MALTLASCKGGFDGPAKALELEPGELSQRQVQSRQYDTQNELMILSACSEVLLDLGFAIDESSSESGFLVASKNREAVETDQVFSSILLLALTGVAAPWDHNQKIRVSIIVGPGRDEKTVVRATFQRIVWNTAMEISKAETLREPKLYEDFFSRLSQSVFLQSQNI